MNAWLSTSTTYGTWLPGDVRGFVSNVRVEQGPRTRHNIPGTLCDADIPTLEATARQKMKGAAVRLTQPQAAVLSQQFQETASFRNWRLLAMAIMCNHVHVVLAANESIGGAELLKDLKSYGSRKLSERFGRPQGGTWWTSSGSKRHLPDQRAIDSAIEYVMNQQYPLFVWRSDNL